MFAVEKSGPHIELAPLTSESVQECISYEHGGGMQRHGVTRYLGMGMAPTAEDEQEWFDKICKDQHKLVWGIWLIENDISYAHRCVGIKRHWSGLPTPASSARQPAVRKSFAPNTGAKESLV